MLRKPRSYGEIYNDLDGDIVNFFRVLRDQGDELSRRIALTPFAREEFYEAYSPGDDDIERARRVLVRSHMGFGSTLRPQRSEIDEENINRMTPSKHADETQRERNRT